MMKLWTVFAFLIILLTACTDDSTSNYAVSTLTRPVAMSIAVIDWVPSESDEQYADYFEDYEDDDYWSGFWSECLTKNKRAFGFVANSGNNSVARIDLCTGEVQNTHIKGNPFVVSHIAVGKFPVDLATSIDEGQTRLFVSNGGEDTLSIIMTKEAITLQDKVELSSRPSALAVVPSDINEEGDVYVAMAEIGKLAKVSKYEINGDEVWLETSFATLKTQLTPDPLPGGMVVDPNGKYLYVSDMNSNYFHIVDLDNPEFPAVVKNVFSPQRNCDISPDGRFLYLPKMDSRKIAVYDLVEDKYIDTNSELPSHLNSPTPSELIDYDIQLQSIPKAAVFVDVSKVRRSEVDGDEDLDTEDEAEISDGDSDEEIETETDVEDESEVESDSEEENEAEESAGKFKADGDLDEELEDDAEENETEVSYLEKNLYAYSIGFNGSIQVIDVHNNLHKLYDTNPQNGAELALLGNDELEVDNGLCLADIDVELYTGVTLDALWEVFYNGVIPQSDITVSGRFEFDKSHFIDSNMDFSSLEEIHPRPADYNPEDPESLKGDWLEITTQPISPVNGQGCFETVIDEEGQSTLKQLTLVKLEILEVTPEYIKYDDRGINLENCFNTAVTYQIRSNENYLVYMTRLDASGSRIGTREYQGRAINTEFSPSTVISSEEQYETLVFEHEDWQDFVCTIENTNEDGSTYNEYKFRQNMNLVGSDEPVKGMSCLSGLNSNDLPISFENEFIRFSICQDIDDKNIKLKRQDTFLYSFRTYSGINEILQVVEDEDGLEEEAYDRFVGSVLEDAVYTDLYDGYPYLFVVDSAEELVYVIDLSLDEVVRIIQ